MIPIKNILVAVDFSETAMYAARQAAAIAQDQQARLYVLHVEAPFPVHGRFAGGALEHVQKQRIHKENDALSNLLPDDVKKSIVVEEIKVTGSPMSGVIVEKARELNVDVIVMPAQQPKGWLRFFREDVMSRVIQNAPCSVFVVRSPKNNHRPKL